MFAIIVTLLVLELKVPHLKEPGSVGELADQLIELAPKFVSWLISFVIVCKFWLNHHYLLSLARHANYGMMWLNSLFLLGQSFIPFPTALAGEYPHNALAVCLFGVVFSLNTLMFVLLAIYIRHNLVKPEFAAGQEPTAVILTFVLGPGSYLIGAALGWVNIYVAFAVYALTPLFYVTPWNEHGSDGRKKPAPGGNR